jgi:hypothetical protein
MSTITVETILQQVIQLPRIEQRRLVQLIEEQQTNTILPSFDKRVPCEPQPDRTREWEWIAQHKDEYAGQWVALEGDHLIAASPSRMELSAALKTAGAKRPLIHRLPAPDELPYVGI